MPEVWRDADEDALLHYIVKRNREIAAMPEPVVMCSCADWLQCEHPYPAIMHRPPQIALIDGQFQERR